MHYFWAAPRIEKYIKASKEAAELRRKHEGLVKELEKEWEDIWKRHKQMRNKHRKKRIRGFTLKFS